MAFDPEKVTFFAKTDARGQNIPFGIKAKDRTKHVYVIGKTGMGKSTLLENMAVQDIQSGEGVAFIDPHGSTAEKLLEYIPEERVNDVLYFAPFDMAHPVSFNIMEDVGPDRRHLVVSGLMSVFEKIWVDAWSARMAYILQNTLLALLEYPDSTLLGVNRMLSDKAYRNLVVDNIKDPGVKSFWVDEFAKYNERYMQEAGDAIKNKIGQFTANPVIRNIIGQPKSSFDIRKMMDEKKIIVMNLSKGLIGETNANLLGSMLTTRIYLAAMSRADLPQEKMRELPNFYFYVDEFQSFANATFADILSEARKYKLNLTIAHQYIEQMEEEVKNAVFGNVGTIITFRVGPFDAEVLETIFSPKFYAADIVNLGFAQVYLTLMIDGIGSPPFSATTLPPIEPPHISHKDMVIAASRRQFAKLRADVEALVNKFHEPIIVPKKNSANPLGGGQGGQSNQSGSSPRGAGRFASRTDRPPQRPARGESEQRSENGGGLKGGSPQKRPKQDLNELRSILKDISAQSNESRDTRTEKSEKPEHRTPKTEKPKRPDISENKEKADLKNALESVIRNTQKKGPVSPPRDVRPSAQKLDTTTHAQESFSHTPDQQELQTKSGASDRDGIPPGVSTHTNNDISPKELERMMRITTSDRMHFK